MLSPAPHEVAMFEQIHALLEQQRTSTAHPSPAEMSARLSRESRSARRRPYECAQLVAPMIGDNPPAQGAFTLVQCRDISPGGFSYFADEHPKHDRVVIALGLAPFSFFIAEIVRVEQPERTTDWRWLVGCQILQRLEPTARHSQ
jgi:hypothetical protein